MAVATAMQRWTALFGRRARPAAVGMIHVGALPGTPRSSASVAALAEHAVSEARIYARAGIDALALENMHDIPYTRSPVGPEVVAAMAVVAAEVRRELGSAGRRIPLGLQVLAAANREAVAVAHATGLDFVRAEGYVYAHVADEGFIQSCAGDLLRYRRSIGADNVLVLADIKKKHSSHSITADVSLTETAHAAEFFLADGVIVTGIATGAEAAESDVREVAEACGDRLPVLVGSGVTAANVGRYCRGVHGVIVGSHFKAGGNWAAPLEGDRVARFMEAIERFA